VRRRRRRRREEEEKYVGDPWHRSISTIEEIQHVELEPPNIYGARTSEYL